MYHVYHGHHGHHGHHRHHHQQLFVLWQCWCQGKVSCNSSEAATCNFLPLVATSNHIGIEQIQHTILFQVDFPHISVTQLLLM